jgi:hypothetical protein
MASTNPVDAVLRARVCAEWFSDIGVEPQHPPQPQHSLYRVWRLLRLLRLFAKLRKDSVSTLPQLARTQLVDPSEADLFVQYCSPTYYARACAWNGFTEAAPLRTGLLAISLPLPSLPFDPRSLLSL